MDRIERAKKIFFEAIDEYVRFKKTQKYRDKMKKHPLKTKDIVKMLAK